MLDNIKKIKPGLPFAYDNVFICEIGTVIEFWIRIDGHDGFAFSVKDGADNYIMNTGLAMQPPSVWVGCCHYDDGSNIVVRPTTDLKLNESDSVKHQRINICAWEMESYKRNGEVYMIRHDIKNRSKRSQDNVMVQGEDIRTAAVEKGDASLQKHWSKAGNSDAVIRKDRKLAEINIHCFAFASKEAAERIVGFMDLPYYGDK